MRLRVVWVVAIAICALANSGSAFAAQRTFVASTGNDANPCSLTLPCRGFAAAVAAVDAGGEVVALDSAGYGPVTITQALSIVAPPGVHAGVTVLSGTGIVVDTGTGTVRLAGLTLNGLGGQKGIEFLSGDALRIEWITATGFRWGSFGTGLSVVGGNPRTVSVVDSSFVGNDIGAWFDGSIRATVARSRFDQNTSGAIFGSGTTGTVDDSTFIANSHDGAQSGTHINPGGAIGNMIYRNCVFSGGVHGIIVGGAPLDTAVLIADSVVSHNGYGITVDWGRVTLANTIVTHNQFGVWLSGGTCASFGDNRIYGNVGAEVCSAAPAKL